LCRPWLLRTALETVEVTNDGSQQRFLEASWLTLAAGSGGIALLVREEPKLQGGIAQNLGRAIGDCPIETIERGVTGALGAAQQSKASRSGVTALLTVGGDKQLYFRGEANQQTFDRCARGEQIGNTEAVVCQSTIATQRESAIERRE
jgi:hypothetical protein